MWEVWAPRSTRSYRTVPPLPVINAAIIPKHHGLATQTPLTGKIIPDTTFEESDFRNKYFRGDRKAASL
jgi:hypothetical protein